MVLIISTMLIILMITMARKKMFEIFSLYPLLWLTNFAFLARPLRTELFFAASLKKKKKKIGYRFYIYVESVEKFSIVESKSG